MKLWLDDVREPWKHGCIGWHWAKTAQEAIDILKTGQIEEASLDHDLAAAHYPWNCTDIDKCAGTGYDVVCWMEENETWPPLGVKVHSMNPVGRQRMEQVIERSTMDNWGEILAILDEQTRLCDAGRKEAAEALQPKLRELLEQRRRERLRTL